MEDEVALALDMAGGGDYMEEYEEYEEEEFFRRVSSEYDIDYTEEIGLFRDWLLLEPYLMKDYDDDFITTFIHYSENLDDAQERYTRYFYVRQSDRLVFQDRHPCSPNNLVKYDAVCVVPLTSPLDKKWIVFHTWLSHDDPTKYSPYHQAKLIFTELDILLTENQVKGKTISIIMDMKDFTEEHTAQITYFAAKKICYFFTECFPAKFNGIYIINPPEFIPDYTALFAPFDFHLIDEIEELQAFLPKRILTSDLGGDEEAPCRDDLFHPFFKRMQKCGNWLAFEEWRRHREFEIRVSTTREEYGFIDPNAPPESEKGKGKKGKKDKKGKKK